MNRKQMNWPVPAQHALRMLVRSRFPVGDEIPFLSARKRLARQMINEVEIFFGMGVLFLLVCFFGSEAWSMRCEIEDIHRKLCPEKYEDKEESK